MRVNWNEIQKAVDNALQWFESQNVKPRLRTLFYRVVSQQLLPNTSSYYRNLSDHMVGWRKQGVFPWDCIVDDTRITIGELYDFSPDEEQVEEIKSELVQKLETFDLDKVLDSYFRTLPSRLASFQVNNWAKQPIGCVLWVEKQALISVLEKWVSELDIPVTSIRGYDSWTDIYEQTRRLNSILHRGHEKVVVLYLGDLDPTGKDIDRFLKAALEYFGFTSEQVEFRRLALTEEQVEKYGLPPRPEDAETLEKLENDPRIKKYAGKYIVELDSLVAYAPEQFRSIIVDVVNSVWDKEVYEEAKEEAEELLNEVEDVIGDAVRAAKEKIFKEDES